MFFPLFIIIRILFIACMVFIIGYVFGGFSKKRALTVITRVAAILVIVLFICTNIILMRGVWGHGDYRHGGYYRHHCDSVSRNI
ncbi:MAG TPA: hypothetical protein VM802_21535 [Chitinophaga sp.]|uniref:hypothetical protein n=1 Tax=Chitinophaga sp. TaxID=1869181 RepID=UPI002C4C7231|nr:hypothetical protein [Chitinophaga sp.]HVI47469.1 hypothetical protein [Chitinophaga sp.]